MSTAELTYYEANAPAWSAQALAGRQLHARTVIVGGGFAGLATAASLAERGDRDCVVLETASVGHGASGRNGGFVFGGFSLEPEDLLRQLGETAARSLYAATREAVGLIRARIARHAMACDAVEGGALWLDWFDSPASRQAIAARQTLLRDRFGVRWDPVAPEQVRQWLHTERYGGALLERDALHFQPLAYARGLAAALAAQGVQVLERSGATRIEAEPARAGSRWSVHTACGGSVHAERVVVAGGGYLQRVLPALEAARLPIATYVVATESLPDAQHPIRTPAALYDNRFAFDYYRRTVDDRILWGGRISILQRDSRRIARLLKRDLLRVFPQLQGVRLSHAWGGLMSYARHQMPQIGQLAPGLWFAQAFGGHGVAPTTLAGEWLAEAMQGAALPQALQRYGLSSVFGTAGLLAAQARYSWAELRDALRDERR